MRVAVLELRDVLLYRAPPIPLLIPRPLCFYVRYMTISASFKKQAVEVAHTKGNDEINSGNGERNL